jgi:hypothetical protein
MVRMFTLYQSLLDCIFLYFLVLPSLCMRNNFIVLKFVSFCSISAFPFFQFLAQRVRLYDHLPVEFFVKKMTVLPFSNSS